MSRDEIIEVIRNQRNLSINKSLTLISDYCIEKGKSISDTVRLVNALSTAPMIIGDYVNTALNYFITKYSICRVYDSRTNEVLHIY